MTLAQHCEPLLLYVCRLNRASRKAGDVDSRQTRADLEALFNQLRVGAAADPVLARQFNQVFLALVFFVDSTIVESELPFAQEWHRKRLAYQLDKLGWAPAPEMAGDEKFVVILDETLADSSADATERLAVLGTCLGLGGTAWFAGQPEHLKRKVLQCSARLRDRMELDENAKICPEAYEHVDRGTPFEPPAAKIGGIGIALLVLLFVDFVVNIYLYRSRTSRMDDALRGIDARLPGEVATS
jgi:type VI protein secretion system component VasF